MYGKNLRKLGLCMHIFHMETSFFLIKSGIFFSKKEKKKKSLHFLYFSIRKSLYLFLFSFGILDGQSAKAQEDHYVKDSK